MGGAVVPPWVVPSESRVRAVRRRAEAWLRSSGGEARYRGITAALYWVAGVSTKSPVAEVDEPPSPGQALVEILAAEQALAREPRTGSGVISSTAAEDEERMARLRRGVYVAAVLTRTASGRLTDADIRFLDGVLDTLRWLLGETDRPPVVLPVQH